MQGPVQGPVQGHEYRVVPAPRRGIRTKGAKRPEERFARAVEAEINRMAEEGWEFVRSDTLPCERRQGWFGRSATLPETLLVFRRPRSPDAAQPRGHAAAMPPPVALPPAGPAPATVPAPAASRFTPVPVAARPANDASPLVPPPLSVVGDEPPAPGAPRDPRRAVE